MPWYSTRDTVDIYFLHYLVGCPSLFDVPSPESETTHDNDWDLPGESYQFFEFLSILSVTRDTPRGVEKFPIRSPSGQPLLSHPTAVSETTLSLKILSSATGVVYKILIVRSSN